MNTNRLRELTAAEMDAVAGAAWTDVFVRVIPGNENTPHQDPELATHTQVWITTHS